MIILLKNKSVPADKYETVLQECQPHFLPLLEHFYINQESVIDRILHGSADAIVITSQRSVEALQQLPKEVLDKGKEKFFNLPAYTVGPATAAAMRRLGFTDVRGEDAGNGAVLAEKMALENKERKFQRMLFLAGEVRRDIIPKRMREEGVDIEELEVYRTEELPECAARTKAALEKGCWLVFFASSGTRNIVSMLKEENLIDEYSLRIASIGPMTTNYLRENGIEPDVTAAKPTPEALLAGISSFDSTAKV